MLAGQWNNPDLGTGGPLRPRGLLCVRRDRHNAVTQTPEPRATLFVSRSFYAHFGGCEGGGERI